jgi:hypothetical protein
MKHNPFAFSQQTKKHQELPINHKNYIMHMHFLCPSCLSPSCCSTSALYSTNLVPSRSYSGVRHDLTSSIFSCFAPCWDIIGIKRDGQFMQFQYYTCNNAIFIFFNVHRYRSFHLWCLPCSQYNSYMFLHQSHYWKVQKTFSISTVRVMWWQWPPDINLV